MIPASLPAATSTTGLPGVEVISSGRNVELAAMLANLTARGIGRLFAEGGTMIHTHEICLILPPSERTCRRLSQDVASRQTLRNRKVINTKSAR